LSFNQKEMLLKKKKSLYYLKEQKLNLLALGFVIC